MLRSLSLSLVALCTLIQAASAQISTDAHDTVLKLFDNTQLVFLGERHLSKLDSEFRIALINRPGFADRVNDIVIEFGNSLYQTTLDAYFLDLEDVSDEALRSVWRNTTTTSGVWDSPIYEAFLREVRRLNGSRPKDTRVRVVAGGPPIDWSNVEVFEDILPYTQRGWWGVRQIEREVLAKNRKALVIYGYGHFLRVDDEMEEDDNIIRRLESLYPDQKFSIVVPCARVDGESLDFTNVIEGSANPIYLDSQSEPVRTWKAN